MIVHVDYTLPQLPLRQTLMNILAVIVLVPYADYVNRNIQRRIQFPLILDNIQEYFFRNSVFHDSGDDQKVSFILYSL